MESLARVVATGAGLITGPAAWAISTQLHYAMAPWICRGGWHVVPFSAALLVLLALAGAFLSWRHWRRRRSGPMSERPDGGAPYEMLAVLGMLSGPLFALIIVLQAAASLIVTGCAP